MKRLLFTINFFIILVTASHSQSEWVVYKYPNLPDNRVYNVTFDANGNKWIGTYEGLARLTGSTWTSYYSTNSGLPNNTIYSFAVDANGHKWIGTNGGGLAHFTGLATGAAGWNVFSTSNSQLPDNYVRYSIVIDASGNKWIGTRAGLTKFDGQNWTSYNSTNTALPHNEIRTMALDANQNLWIGTPDGMARFNGSQGWTVFKPSNPISDAGLPHNNIMSIAIAPNGTKWIGTSGGLVKYDNTTMVTYKTTNSNIPSNSVVAVAAESNNVIWIATNLGLTKFDGVNWINFNTSNSDLPHSTIHSITIDADGNKWIGTYAGLAVFREGGVVSVEKDSDVVPAEFSLGQNYPNPFNPSTTISFSIPKSGNVKLSVFDVLGKQIALLVNGYLEAGNYKTEFNGMNLASGIYFYRIETNGVVISKKMNLLK